MLSLVCAYWLTVSQATQLLYQTNGNEPLSDDLPSSVQTCMTEHEGEWHYTDKCISLAFPGKPLLIEQECGQNALGQWFCLPHLELVRDGELYSLKP